VHGHHYALVEVGGLEPGTTTAYDVRLDGRVVWPKPGSRFPPSVVRTFDASRPLRLTFGSCRTSVPHTPAMNRTHGVDTLRAFAGRMAGQQPDEWPDALLLVGDQVYADETSEEMQRLIAARRDVDEEPGPELADFEEYTYLYRLAWTDPANRWLLSTLPSAMIFDDHDIRDDWNTSATWREQMAAQPWWRDRIVGGLASYWVYQHLGNLSPVDRAEDPLLAAVRAADGDAGEILDEFARASDEDPRHNRWSFARDFGRVRLVVLDSRAARVLEPGQRTLIDDQEWAWFDALARGDVDHLLIGTSLPYLLPTGIHHVEGWNEAVAEGAWGPRAARWGETVRQASDLEHWAGFRRSFDAMARVVREVATGGRGRPPATIVFLSGDVHYSYLARARVPGQGVRSSRIYQAVCSPIRNPLPQVVRYANGVASFGLARVVGRGLARAARVRDPAIGWTVEHGPWFDNALATLMLDGRNATILWETGRPDGSAPDGDEETVHLEELHRYGL
ncbi:MAG: alkaline phosphatase D family protein, partial [Actinomycetes bacterium]